MSPAPAAFKLARRLPRHNLQRAKRRPSQADSQGVAGTAIVLPGSRARRAANGGTMPSVFLASTRRGRREATTPRSSVQNLAGHERSSQRQQAANPRIAPKGSPTKKGTCAVECSSKKARGRGLGRFSHDMKISSIPRVPSEKRFVCFLLGDARGHHSHLGERLLGPMRPGSTRQSHL